jgi:hypothetical protein
MFFNYNPNPLRSANVKRVLVQLEQMVSVFGSCALDRSSGPVGSNQRLYKWYLLLLC